MRTKMLAILLASLVVLLAGVLPGAGQEQEKKENKPVLLVIDVQNIWMPFMDKEDRGTAPDKINELIAMFHASNQPVIRVYHTDPDRGPAPGTKAFEFVDSIDIMDSDGKVIKNFPSAFTRTDLEQILRESGRTTVFLCGLSATGCVLATYFGALDRDLSATIVRGAVLSSDASNTRVIESICASTTVGRVRNMLASLSQ